jgi:transposase-like protein
LAKANDEQRSQDKREYTDEDHKNFAVLYLLHGNVKKIAETMKIPSRTLYPWLKQSWFPAAYDEAKREYAELLEARLSDIVEKATTEILERLANGDEILTKEGDIVRVKVSTRDLTTLLREGIDKIRLLQNKPAKVTAEVHFNVNQIEKNFAELADKYHDRIVATQ